MSHNVQGEKKCCDAIVTLWQNLQQPYHMVISLIRMHLNVSPCHIFSGHILVAQCLYQETKAKVSVENTVLDPGSGACTS